MDQKYGIRVLTDQCIVLADAKGFTNFFRSTNAAVVENFLLEYDDLMNDICAKHGGVIRQINGDMYFITFEKAEQTISALKMLCLVLERYNVGMSVGAHKGNLFLFRSYAFSGDVNTTGYLSELSKFYKSGMDQIFVVIGGKLLDETNFTGGDVIFQPLDGEKLTQEIYRTIVREHRAYRLMVE